MIAIEIPKDNILLILHQHFIKQGEKKDNWKLQ